MESPSGFSGSILCVDSDPAVAKTVEDILPGHETVTAVNGYEALRALYGRTFDLYLLDYWLPDWSGIQLCREIREIDPGAPVFFCTRAARDEDRRRALRAGASAYLLKPLDPPVFARQAHIALELALVESLRARIEEERAVADELIRLGEVARSRALDARERVARAARRTVRAKALKAFVEAGGTRANFERWWPQAYQEIEAKAGYEAAHRPPISHLPGGRDSELR